MLFGQIGLYYRHSEGGKNNVHITPDRHPDTLTIGGYTSAVHEGEVWKI